MVTAPRRADDEDAGPVRDVVVCSLESWDDVWRRNQFVVRELLARDPGRRVLFVEPPVDLLHPPSWRGGVWGPGLHRVRDHPGLWRLRPVKVLPRAVRSSAERGLVAQVLAASSRLGFSGPVLWVNDSTYADLADRTGWPTVYDVTDDWLLASASPRELARRCAREDRLVSSAGAVVVCSPALASSRGARRQVVLIPNAVDVDRFTAPHPRPADLPPSPTAVYVGTLHEDRFDVGLCIQLAQTLGELTVVLVGPCALGRPSVERLVAHSNIRLLGPRPYDSVPAYLQHADVLIVPHLVTPFTDSLDPIKAYECLAVGRPTVATPVAGFRPLEAQVEIAQPGGFVDAVKAVLHAGVRRPAAGALPSWAERAEQFARVLDDVSRQAPPAPQAPRPLRVAYVDHCARRSGGELALARILPAMAGVEASVILAEDGPLVADLAAAGAVVSVLSMDERARGLPRDRVRARFATLAPLVATARHVAALRRRLLEIDPDLVHTNSLKAAVYGGLAGRLAGLPVVWHVRDRIAEDYLPRTAVRQVRFLLRWVPSAVIANSHATAATLGAHRGRPPVRVVHDAVPVPPAIPEPPDLPLRVGMVGRIAPWKGQGLFLRAFAAAFPRGDERAVIVGAPLFGEHDFEGHLHRLAEELGLGDRVEFRGFRHDVPAELARLHVLVHASTIPEPFGMVVVEGMALGRPVVAAGVGGPAEVITDGVDGVLYPMGDVEALAAALRSLADQPGRRAQLGEAAARRAAAFAPAVVARGVLATYDAALGSRRTPCRRGARP